MLKYFRSLIYSDLAKHFSIFSFVGVVFLLSYILISDIFSIISMFICVKVDIIKYKCWFVFLLIFLYLISGFQCLHHNFFKFYQLCNSYYIFFILFVIGYNYSLYMSNFILCSEVYRYV